MALNQYLPFGTAGGSNVLSSAAYTALAARLSGFVAGTASSTSANTAWRQASVVAAMIGQFTADNSGNDILDDGNVAGLETNFSAAIKQLVSGGLIHYGPDSGTADALVMATPIPAITAYAIGQVFRVLKIGLANTLTTPSINVAAFGAKTIVKRDNTSLAPGDLPANAILDLEYDGTNMRLVSVAISEFLSSSVSYGADIGTATALAVTIASYGASYIVGKPIWVKAGHRIGDNATINVNGIGAKNLVWPSGGGSAQVEFFDFDTNDMISMVYDGTSMVLASPMCHRVISTALTFTAHGITPDFADLNKFTQWLSRRRIDHSATVLVNVAAGNGTSNRLTYASPVTWDHPDQGRVSIIGANLLASAPNGASFTASGHTPTTRSNDAITNLAMLRTIYATELYFPGGINGFNIWGGPIGGGPTSGGTIPVGGGLYLKNMLITGDRTATGTGGNGILATSSFNPDNVSTHAFGSNGVSLVSAAVQVSGGGSGFCLSASACVGGGISMDQSAQLLNAGNLVSVGNDAQGITLNGGQCYTIGSGVVTCKGNGAQGAYVAQSAFFGCGAGSVLSNNSLQGIVVIQANAAIIGASVTGNGSYGVHAVDGGFINAQGATIGVNTTNPIMAEEGGYVDALTASITGTPSPALNTRGNNSAYIAN